MRTYLDCIPCFLNQALRAGRLATNDEEKIKRLLDEVGVMFRDMRLDATPVEIAIQVYQKVREITGSNDPYRAIKAKNTQKALSLYSSLKKRIEKSDDKLLTAIRIAIAGNVIDFGVNRAFDIEQEIDENLTKDFAINDYAAFSRYMDRSDEILFIGDNAGEAVFDRILIEEMKKQTVYAVRDIPVINDVTRDDAIQAGIDKVATILSSGTNAPGTVLKTCNQNFIKTYNNAGFVISKGQGNYEALSEERRPMFFLLKAKCHILANDIGVNEGDIILKGINCNDL